MLGELVRWAVVLFYLMWVKVQLDCHGWEVYDVKLIKKLGSKGLNNELLLKYASPTL